MTTFVKMTVSATDYYISDSGYAGENYWYPFLLENPRIKWAGDGWMKTEVGNLVLVSKPSDSNHPFSYSSGNFSAMLSSPSTEYSLTINYNNESTEQNEILWYGKAIFSEVTTEAISFRLFESNPAVSATYYPIGKFPVYWVSAGNPTNVILRTGSGNPLKIKKGDAVIMTPKAGSAATLPPLVPNQIYLVTSDCVSKGGLGFTAYELNISADRTGEDVVFCNPEFSGDSESAPVWWLNKVITFNKEFLSASHFKRPFNEEGHLKWGWDTYDWIAGPEYSGSASSMDVYEDGVQITESNSGYLWRKSSGDLSGTLTYQFPSGSAYNTINDAFDLKTSTNLDIVKAPNADDSDLSSIDILVGGNKNEYDFLDWLAKNTNHQFYVRYANSSDSDPTIFLIDRANTPATTALSNTEIISVDYLNVFPIASIKTAMNSYSEVGSAADDNYQLVKQTQDLEVLNSSSETGRAMTIKQVADRYEMQKQYLEAILTNRIKPVLSVAVDNIKTTILPGDNLTFTQANAPVTVSSLLVRAITYDLAQERTIFNGDATITILETT